MSMNKFAMKEAILKAKFEKGLKWNDIAKAACLSTEYTCSACLGMNHLDKQQADAVTKVSAWAMRFRRPCSAFRTRPGARRSPPTR